MALCRFREFLYEEAEALIYEAYDNGMTFYDTARFYTDSEEKLGRAIAKRGIRDKVYIASKTMCNTTEEFWSQLAQSLSDLQTDYLISISSTIRPSVQNRATARGSMRPCWKQKAQGKVRHIGITNHRLAVAHEAIDSGLYETPAVSLLLPGQRTGCRFGRKVQTG